MYQTKLIDNVGRCKRFLLIGCSVLARECYLCASRTKNIVDLRILKQGLHDIGEAKMASALQQEIDAVDPQSYDAILMAYGLCNNGIRGLQSKLPIVIPRAHDCITLLLGSKEIYKRYFDENPGTFFESTGWCEQAKDNLSNPESTTRQMGMTSYQEYVEIYGEENAKYMYDILGDHLKNYSKLAYINTGVADDDFYKEECRRMSTERGWVYEELKGSTQLLLKLMNGEWDLDEFLIVNPGKSVTASYDENIIDAE